MTGTFSKGREKEVFGAQLSAKSGGVFFVAILAALLLNFPLLTADAQKQPDSVVDDLAPPTVGGIPVRSLGDRITDMNHEIKATNRAIKQTMADEFFANSDKGRKAARQKRARLQKQLKNHKAERSRLEQRKANESKDAKTKINDMIAQEQKALDKVKNPKNKQEAQDKQNREKKLEALRKLQKNVDAYLDDPHLRAWLIHNLGTRDPIGSVTQWLDQRERSLQTKPKPKATKGTKVSQNCGKDGVIQYTLEEIINSDGKKVRTIAAVFPAGFEKGATVTHYNYDTQETHILEIQKTTQTSSAGKTAVVAQQTLVLDPNNRVLFSVEGNFSTFATKPDGSAIAMISGDGKKLTIPKNTVASRELGTYVTQGNFRLSVDTDLSAGSGDFQASDSFKAVLAGTEEEEPVKVAIRVPATDEPSGGDVKVVAAADKGVGAADAGIQPAAGWNLITLPEVDPTDAGPVTNPDGSTTSHYTDAEGKTRSITFPAPYISDPTAPIRLEDGTLSLQRDAKGNIILPPGAQRLHNQETGNILLEDGSIYSGVDAKILQGPDKKGRSQRDAIVDYSSAPTNVTPLRGGHWEFAPDPTGVPKDTTGTTPAAVSTQTQSDAEVVVLPSGPYTRGHLRQLFQHYQAVRQAGGGIDLTTAQILAEASAKDPNLVLTDEQLKARDNRGSSTTTTGTTAKPASAPAGETEKTPSGWADIFFPEGVYDKPKKSAPANIKTSLLHGSSVPAASGVALVTSGGSEANSSITGQNNNYYFDAGADYDPMQGLSIRVADCGSGSAHPVCWAAEEEEDILITH